MFVQIVQFESTLSKEELMAVARKRLPQYKAKPGLLQKYYIKGSKPNHYGGVYIWDSMESLEANRESDLAKSIPNEYKVVGQPSVEIHEAVIQLRE